jgi:redox-sensitive bicupin YhaK (pirin superfamily)
MIDVRRFSTLGRFQNDWLNANYHFSFSGYDDPERRGWGALRVWNDDEIKPHTGFAPHGHTDMEIITYVREGAITHEDSLGNRGRTEAGDVQVMSAGAGVRHAEYNREDGATRLFQIWIEPKQRGGAPSWGAAKFPKAGRAGRFVTLASGFEADIANGALPIRQDARVLGATATAGAELSFDLAPGRRAYFVLAKGAGTLNGVPVGARDGAAIKDVATINFVADEDVEALLVETL